MAKASMLNENESCVSSRRRVIARAGQRKLIGEKAAQPVFERKSWRGTAKRVATTMWIVTLAIALSSIAQPRPGPGERPMRDPEAARPPFAVTHIPSAAGGEQGIAVGVLPPKTARYAEGAPVVIHVPGGVDKGQAVGPPEFAGLGFVEIYFAFPDGGEGEAASGGRYDFRGPNCLRALADVIHFATGRLADRQGRKLHELLPGMKVLTKNVGVLGYSHGGNACGMVMATHGEEFSDLAFYASMESPYGEGNVNIELGSRDERLNPAYDPHTGVLDLSKLAWSAELRPGLPARWESRRPGPQGALFFDLNGDNRFSESVDYPANAVIQDLGTGPKVWYSPRLVRQAEERNLYGGTRPAHMPSWAEAIEYWRWRDAAGSIPEAVRKCPEVAVIVYANHGDHVQIAPDHPHILTQVEGFRQAGAKFVRLNPDRVYVERIFAAGGPAGPRARQSFADNDAGAAWDRNTIRGGLEPPGLPIAMYMQAAVCELADRVQVQNWTKNLNAVLFPDSPWTVLGGRKIGGPRDKRPPQAKPALGSVGATAASGHFGESRPAGATR